MKASESRGMEVVLGKTGTVETGAVTGRHIYQQMCVWIFLLMLPLFPMYSRLVL